MNEEHSLKKKKIIIFSNVVQDLTLHVCTSLLTDKQGALLQTKLQTHRLRSFLIFKTLTQKVQSPHFNHPDLDLVHHHRNIIYINLHGSSVRGKHQREERTRFITHFISALTHPGSAETLKSS